MAGAQKIFHGQSCGLIACAKFRMLVLQPSQEFEITQPTGPEFLLCLPSNDQRRSLSGLGKHTHRNGGTRDHLNASLRTMPNDDRVTADRLSSLYCIFDLAFLPELSLILVPN